MAKVDEHRYPPEFFESGTVPPIEEVVARYPGDRKAELDAMAAKIKASVTKDARLKRFEGSVQRFADDPDVIVRKPNADDST